MSAGSDSRTNLTADEKRVLLAELLQRKNSEPKSFPLSFAQSRLWILDRFQPGNAVYNLPMVLRLPGSLDVDVLARSLNEIVRRHDTLRTTFKTVDAKPVQVVAPLLELKIALIDLRHLPDSERDVDIGRIVYKECEHSFDLVNGPLIRATLLELADTDHVFIVVMHHIISDGWSLGVLYNEISTLYTAYSTGQQPQLADLPIQYSDFARWQTQWLTGDVLEQQLAYWKSRLRGIRPLLDLPADRPRPEILSYRGAVHTFSLRPEVCAGLNALNQRTGVTMFMTLLAAFKTLLHRYTGETDIVIGSPIANRTSAELENLIGFFVNTLVLRTDLSGDPTFLQLLEGVREVTLGAYAHQDMPFEKLVEELRPERDLSQNPLFQIMFALQNFRTRDRDSTGPANTASPTLPVGNGTAKFDLTLSVAESEPGAQAFLEYNTDLFDETTIVRMMEVFQVLLFEMVRNPDQRLSRLSILGEIERSKLASGWNGPHIDSPVRQTIHDLIAAHAQRTPDQVAILSGDEKLSYRQLNDRANRLAHYLRKLGFRAGALAGIYMERSAEMIVAALGILKAGGAYVPLDPEDPVSRLTLILEDSRIFVVLTEKDLGVRLPEGLTQVFCAEKFHQNNAADSFEEFNATNFGADSLACVLYQSSPSGRPEGVALAHRALCRTPLWPEICLTASDRVAQTSSLSAVTSRLDVWNTLAAGATLVLAPVQPPITPRRFAGLLRDHQATVLLAPVALAERLAHEFPWALRTVRLLLVENQNKRQSLTGLQRTLEAGVLKQVIAFYGPAETGGFCAFQSVTTMPATTSSATLGSPAAGAKFHLLDAQLEPVPAGVIGEIYIGDAGLTHGYYGQPARTSAAFVPDPFSRVPGARLYRTGDLGRRLPNGELHYLARRDAQVTIRGLRIEPAEIETVLLRNPAVRETAVMASDKSGPSGVDLIAVVVLDQAQLVTTEDLRSFVAEHLPEVMIPAKYVLLDALPRTAKGTVDRRALAELLRATDDATGAIAYTAPRNDAEQQLANLWAQTLGVPEVSIYENFFNLGGHSLLAAQVVARVNDVFSVDLPLDRLFAMPTIAELSTVIEQLVQAGSKPAHEPIPRMAREVMAIRTEQSK
jgi:amino acid adenylation domain-containing protein